MKTKKKKFFTKNGTLFTPNLSGHLRSDANQSQIIGGDADVDHTQTIGGDTAKLLEGIYPPIPPGFGTPEKGSRRLNLEPVKSDMDNGLLLLRHNFKRSCATASAISQKWIPQTLRTLLRNKASVIKI